MRVDDQDNNVAVAIAVVIVVRVAVVAVGWKKIRWHFGTYFCSSDRQSC